MRIGLLKQHEGQVSTLDLISGKEITTRITKVDVEAGTVTCSKPMMFVPMPNPHNPANVQVQAIAYGQPLYEVTGDMEIDCEHIFTIFETSPEQRDAYIRHTSGIVSAGAGIMDQLKDIDMNSILK